MTTRYGSHVAEDGPASQDSVFLDLAPLEHPMPEGDIESSDEYCEETYTHCPLAELLEQFRQLKDQVASLKSTTPQATPAAELMQLTDKLQHLTMMLQPAQNHVCIHGHLACNTQRIKPHHHHAPKIFPHLMGRTPKS